MTAEVTLKGKVYRLRFVDGDRLYDANWACSQCAFYGNEHDRPACHVVCDTNGECQGPAGIGSYWKEHILAPSRARNSQ